MSAAEKIAEPQAWFDTAQAATYLCLKSAAALRKHVERGHIRPDSCAGANGMRCHRFKQR
jgi:hypothetical protein